MIRLRIEWLYAIDAPHFYAGLIVRDGVVIQAAPILAWSIGKRWDWLQKYFVTKKWSFQNA